MNRNYAVCVAAFIGLFSLSWWWMGARRYEDEDFGLWSLLPADLLLRKYTGPRTRDILMTVGSDEFDNEPEGQQPPYSET